MRNFLYNKSDILTAVLIIVIAAGVVFWRVGVIMNDANGGAGKASDFSALILPWTQGSSDAGTATGAGTDASNVTPSNDGAAASNVTPSGDGAAASNVTPSTDGAAASAGTQTPAAGTQTPAAGAQTPAAPATGAPVSFTVNSGDVASVIANNLASAGLVNSADDFLAEVNNQNAASSLKAGTFDIPKGSTPAQIVAILTK